MANEVNNIPKVSVFKHCKEMLAEGDVIIARHLAILKPVLQFFQKNVLVQYMHGEFTTVEKPDIIINMWSNVSNSELIFPDLETAFGFKYCNDAVFAPNENAVTFGDDVPLIQYLPDLNRIDFLYDVCEYKSEDELNLMKKLVSGLLMKIAGSKEKAEEKINSFQEYLLSLKRVALIKTLTANEERNNNNRKQRLENNRQSLQQYRASIRNLVISIASDEQLIMAGASILDGIETKLNDEFNIIRANKKVENIDVDVNGMLNIFTKPLYANVMCEDGKVRRYFFGRFRINVNIGSGAVKFFNMNIENTRRGHWSKNDPHPHVDGRTGQACLGNASTLIADCIDTYQWGALADILINYLESANTTDSAGRKVYRWTEVDAEGNIVPIKNKYFGGNSDNKDYMVPVLTGGNYIVETEEEYTTETLFNDWEDDEDYEENDGDDE